MTETIIDLGQGFWSIRGDLRLGGVVNVGTQASLIRRSNGRFVMLDSYRPSGAVHRDLMALTENGRAVEAVLNLHPFHTLHCKALAQELPNATFYGSARHRAKAPDLNWAEDPVESPAVAALFPELQFSLPAGIDYISDNEKVHAGSLLAYHPASRSLHVDDTLNVLPIPGWLRNLLGLPRLSFHPTVKSALKAQAGAAASFCDWADDLADRWADTRNLCAAHSALIRLDDGEFAASLHAITARQQRKFRKAGLIGAA